MATSSVSTAFQWLFAPATDEVPRAQAIGAAALRVLVGLLWLYNVAWKRAPEFGEDAGNGLFKFTSAAVDHPVFPPFSWVVENVVLPNFALFGWGVLAAETALAVLLLTGAWVRLAALVGIAQSVAIGLSVAFAPNEWPWSYWLMIGAHGLLLVSSAGRVFAVDAVRARLAPPRSIALPWGVAAVLVGAFSVLASLDDPLAKRGPGLRSTDLSISLGEYNLVGGLVLVGAGALLLAAAGGTLRIAALVGAGLALLGGLSLHAQLGFSDPLLGGTATSAAFLISVGVVAAVVGSRDLASAPDVHQPAREQRNTA
ncbi:MAG: Rv1678 family membrane protein [Aeromicrobium sp.]